LPASSLILNGVLISALNEALHRSRRQALRLAAFPRLNPNPVLAVDPTGSVTFANPGALTTLNKLGPEYRATYFLPRDWEEIRTIPGESQESVVHREVLKRIPCSLLISAGPRPLVSGIRNAQVAPEYESIKPHIGGIGIRAISSLTKFQGVGDLYRIYVLAQRDGIDYNLAYIPPDFHPKRVSEFDTKYMHEEFTMAYDLERSGYKWSKYPPGFEPANPESALGQPGR
jgi:hypothetical protein